MKSRTLRYITKNQVKRFNWSQKKNKFPLSLNTNKILSKLKLASNLVDVPRWSEFIQSCAKMHALLTWIALSGRTEDPSLPFIETMMETHMILTFLFRAASSPDCCGRRYWAEMLTAV